FLTVSGTRCVPPRCCPARRGTHRVPDTVRKNGEGGLMDLEELRRLVAQGESERLEFKRTTGELKDGMSGICAMLNGEGGRVFFGVTPSGKISGQDVTDNTLQDIAREIKKLEPQAYIQQTLVTVADTRQVIVL